MSKSFYAKYADFIMLSWCFYFFDGHCIMQWMTILTPFRKFCDWVFSFWTFIFVHFQNYFGQIFLEGCVYNRNISFLHKTIDFDNIVIVSGSLILYHSYTLLLNIQKQRFYSLYRHTYTVLVNTLRCFFV